MGFFQSATWPHHRAPVTLVTSVAFALFASACVPQGASSSSASGKLLTEGRSAPDASVPLTVPNNVAPIGDSSVSKVASGLQHTCALRSGELSCWGLNKHGQIGNGEAGVIDGQVDALTGSKYTVRVALEPHRVFASDVTDVALGYEHTCAIRGEELFCWGSNDYGQLGLPATAGKLVVSPASVAKGVKQVSARGRWTCAVTTTGRLLCFGTRLVRSGADLIPRLVSSLPKEIVASGAQSVSVSANHACAVVRIGNDSTLRCFGMNSYGEVGNGNPDGEDVSAPVEVFSSGVSVVRVSESRSCAIVNGGMKCFGVTLGDRQVDETAGAWRIPSPNPYDSVFWKGIAPGLRISSSGCVLASTGDLFYGSFFHAEGRPQKIALGAISFDYSENDQNGCVMFRNRAVKCWGANLFGQLGSGRRTAGDVSIFKAQDVRF
jgi:alpha-tubulin suppressor-like RCC1 family protein